MRSIDSLQTLIFDFVLILISLCIIIRSGAMFVRRGLAFGLLRVRITVDLLSVVVLPESNEREFVCHRQHVDDGLAAQTRGMWVVAECTDAGVKPISFALTWTS